MYGTDSFAASWKPGNLFLEPDAKKQEKISLAFFIFKTDPQDY